MRVILALRLSQGEFHASLGYKERSDFKRKAFVKHSIPVRCRHLCMNAVDSFAPRL